MKEPQLQPKPQLMTMHSYCFQNKSKMKKLKVTEKKNTFMLQQLDRPHKFKSKEMDYNKEETT